MIRQADFCSSGEYIEGKREVKRLIQECINFSNRKSREKAEKP